MTDNVPPTRQALAVNGRSKKLAVTGRLKVALDAMLYEGACRADAAAKAGMTDHSVRAALKKVHVLAYYNEGLVVLRTSERARNIRRLTEIRDAGSGTPAVNAIRALELLSEQDGQRPPPGTQSLPGLVVVIGANLPQVLPRAIEHDTRTPMPLPRLPAEHPSAAKDDEQR